MQKRKMDKKKAAMFTATLGPIDGLCNAFKLLLLTTHKVSHVL